MNTFDVDSMTYVENFIKNNREATSGPDVSDYYKDNALKCWRLIKDYNVSSGSYIFFAESAQGLCQYSYYKSKSGIIYGLIFYCDSITNYFLIDQHW